MHQIMCCFVLWSGWLGVASHADQARSCKVVWEDVDDDNDDGFWSSRLSLSPRRSFRWRTPSYSQGTGYTYSTSGRPCASGRLEPLSRPWHSPPTVSSSPIPLPQATRIGRFHQSVNQFTCQCDNNLCDTRLFVHLNNPATLPASHC